MIAGSNAGSTGCVRESQLTDAPRHLRCNHDCQKRRGCAQQGQPTYGADRAHSSQRTVPPLAAYRPHRTTHAPIENTNTHSAATGHKRLQRVHWETQNQIAEGFELGLKVVSSPGSSSRVGSRTQPDATPTVRLDTRRTAAAACMPDDNSDSGTSLSQSAPGTRHPASTAGTERVAARLLRLLPQPPALLLLLLRGRNIRTLCTNVVSITVV
jgi:hypothetical protein